MAKKIAFLATTHASRGGILNYISILTTRLELAGYEVHRVALYRGDNDDPLPELIILDESKIIGPVGYVIAVVKFFALCVRMQPSVILGCMPFINILAGLFSAVSNAKSVATHHNPIESQNPKLIATDSRIGKWGFYDVIVCVSDAVAQSFAKHPAAYRERLQVIRNGIPAIAPAHHADDVRQRVGIGENEVMLLMAGRLSPQKNVVGAVSAIGKTHNLKLILTGEGPDRPKLEGIIKAGQLEDRVKLLGVLEKQQMIDLLFAADIFVQVSAYEGHSAALLEAIYAHLPLIVSDVPTQVEAVTLSDGAIAATLCDPNDISDIARAMQFLADSPQERTRLKAASATLARSLRTEEVVLNDYTNLFDRVTGAQVHR